MLDDIATLAAIRGDRSAVERWRAASILVNDHLVQTDGELKLLLDTLPRSADAGLHIELRRIAEDGATAVLGASIGDLPSDLRRLVEAGAVTIGELKVLHDVLGVTSATDLAAEVCRQSIRLVPGLGSPVESAVAAILPTLRKSASPIPLGQADSTIEPLLGRLGELGVDWAVPVGSLRRGRDLIGDIEIVAPAADPSRVFDQVAALPGVDRVLYRSPRRLYIKLEREQVGIRCPTPESAGAALLALTGNAAHLEQLSELATRRGWVLDRDGLHRESRDTRVAATEEAIYAALDLPFIPPEIREGGEELAAAVKGTLPSLIDSSDMRGDLHVHTRWSDGRDSTETMVLAALALGYEYVAITDHSQRAGSSRTLSVEDIPRQAEEIARLRERHPGITVLHGCEVDIMTDGRLDFGDEVLERFDIVLASLHHGAGHSADRLLQRYLEAMRNPFVTIVTHPTNRQFPQRRGYEIDYERLFAAAVETRTVLEIDGGPGHLDLDSALARRATAAGTTVSIDSDAHGAAVLGRQMRLGLLTARRGWVEPRHVLNARPITEVLAWIRTKREGSRSNA